MDLNPITQQIWLPQFLDQSSRFCVITEKEEWINSDRKDSALVRSVKGGVTAPAFRKRSWVVIPAGCRCLLAILERTLVPERHKCSGNVLCWVVALLWQCQPLTV